MKELLLSLIDLYPHITNCQKLVDLAVLDKVIDIKEAQCLMRTRWVWYDMSTDAARKEMA